MGACVGSMWGVGVDRGWQDMLGEVLGDDGQGEGWLKRIDKWRGGEEVCGARNG